MSGVNESFFIGNLGGDPELRHTAGGASVANATLAVNESWYDKRAEERKERVEWVRLVFWAGLADVASQHLSKGSKIYVRGRLQTRSWEDREGTKRYTTEVVVQDLKFLDPKERG